MSLQIEADHQVVRGTCDHCGRAMTRITAFVHRDGDAYAVYFASCYEHQGHEVWIDVVFSPTWDHDADDHLTLGCRVGPIDGQVEPAATLVDAAAAWGQTQVFGRKLSRDEGLGHPLLAQFWDLIDHILVHDRIVEQHLYGEAHGPGR